MNKENITFDNAFISFIKQKITEINGSDKDFKIVNDTSQFQKEDQMKNFAIILLRVYGGERQSLPNVDAAPLQLQILVNTDLPQKWKRVLNQLADDLNGNWLNLNWGETEKYNERNFKFFPKFDTPNMIGNAISVGTSIRHQMSLMGNVFFTTKKDLMTELRLYMIDEMENEEEIGLLTNCVYGFENNIENINPKGEKQTKGYSMGISRYITANLIFDSSDLSHIEILDTFFTDEVSTKTFKIKMEIEDKFEITKNYYIKSLRNSFVTGSSTSIELTLSESGD